MLIEIFNFFTGWTSWILKELFLNIYIVINNYSYKITLLHYSTTLQFTVSILIFVHLLMFLLSSKKNQQQQSNIKGKLNIIDSSVFLPHTPNVSLSLSKQNSISLKT